MTLNPDLVHSYQRQNAAEEFSLNDEVFFKHLQEDFFMGFDGEDPEEQQQQQQVFEDLQGDMEQIRSSTFDTNETMDNSTTNTTPEANPGQNLGYVNRRHSLPIEQFHSLSLKNFGTSQKSKSPSPEYQLFNPEASKPVEEKTINPRQLFTGINSSVLQNIMNSTSENNNYATFTGSSISNTSSNPKSYILPSSSSSTSLATGWQNGARKPRGKVKSNSMSIASDVTVGNKVDLVMNNECFNAILYWMNDTLQHVNSKINDRGEGFGGAEEIMINPTGIIKSDSYRRHNSMPQLSSSVGLSGGKDEIMNSMVNNEFSMLQKRKRRKSNNGEGAPEIPKDFFSKIESVDEEAATSEKEEKGEGSVSPSVDSAGTTNSSQNQQGLPPGLVSQSSFPFSKNNLGSNSPPVLIPPLDNNTTHLSESKETSQDDDEKPFPCPDCSKQFKRSEHLKRHIRSVHSNIRPFHCKYCEKKFSRSDNLAQHLKTHYKLNNGGTTTIIYGNPNLHNRAGRKKLSG